MIRGLLLDLDDTLYDYPPCEAAGRAAIAALASARLGISVADFVRAYDGARQRVKARLQTPSNHSRLLYVHELLHELGADVPSLQFAREFECAFWAAYLGAAALRPGALRLLERFRRHGGKIAIVTDLTLDVQLRKLEHLGLLPHVDALVASEEVGFDKPHRAAFELAAARLGLPLAACAMAGDSDAKDGDGARALGVPFYLVRTPESALGLSLAEIEADLERSNAWKS